MTPGMSLKLANTAEIALELATAASSGAATRLGTWIDGRIVGVLATPDHGTAQHQSVGVSALPPGVSAPRHSHEAEEIAIVLSGTGTITIDDEPIAVATGDIVRTPSNSPHTTTAGPDAPLCILWTYSPAGSEVRWLTAKDEQVTS